MTARERAELDRNLAGCMQQRDAAMAEVATLRRQLEEEQHASATLDAARAAAIAEAAELRRQVAEERMRANAAEFAVAQLRDAAAELRQRLEDEKRRSVIAAHYSCTVIETMRKQMEQAAYYLLGYIDSYRLPAADTPATGEGE